MYSYVTQELREAVLAELPVRERPPRHLRPFDGRPWRAVLALRNPDLYRSVSAFAPIAAPSRCPWGEKAFVGLSRRGPRSVEALRRERADESAAAGRFAEGILIDQGLADQFLAEQLHPEVFEAAAAAAGQTLTLRRHDGYDHGYYFISTFIGEHIAHHARVLCRLKGRRRLGLWCVLPTPSPRAAIHLRRDQLPP